jgi:UDP-N-acetyl-D-mannosaminuronate dehydrogenase
LSIAGNDSWPRSIGVIGLGIMGSAVARHLAAAGRDVIGFDVDASRAGRSPDLDSGKPCLSPRRRGRISALEASGKRF